MDNNTMLTFTTRAILSHKPAGEGRSDLDSTEPDIWQFTVDMFAEFVGGMHGFCTIGCYTYDKAVADQFNDNRGMLVLMRGHWDQHMDGRRGRPFIVEAIEQITDARDIEDIDTCVTP